MRDREPTVSCACCGRDWPHDDTWMVMMAGEERDVCPFCIGSCPLCADAVEAGDVVRVMDEYQRQVFRPFHNTPWQVRQVKVKRLAHAECVEQAERESEDISASDARETYWGDK